MDNTRITMKNKVNASLEQQIIPASDVTVQTSSSDGVVHRTVFTVAQVTQAVTSANLAWGIKLGTLPIGRIAILLVGLALDYECSVSNTEQADIGVGTTVAAGVAATLSGTTAFEDCLDGQTATAFNDTTEVNYVVQAIGELDTKDGTSTARDLFLNIASANSGITGNLLVAGTVTVIWAIV